MTLSFSNRLGLSAIALVAVVAQSGCSSAPREQTSTATPELGGPEVAPVHAASEAARIQEFLDGRYLQSDVQHSFVSKGGDTIDCIDFFAQPGAKQLARLGTPLTRRLPAVPRYKPSAKHTLLDDVAFDGSLDENGSTRQCSNGTVPIVRVTAEQIARVGGLDVYMHALATKAPYRGPGAGAPLADAPDSAGPTYAHAQSDYNGGGTFVATQATLSIYTPALTTSDGGDHSLMQTWTTSTGSQYQKNPSTGVVTTCAPNCQQTVEVGWTVDPVVNPGSVTPHLFVYSTNNGYQSGAYNGGSGGPSWIAAPESSFAVGMALTSGVVGSSERELTIAVSDIGNNGNSAASYQANMNQPGWGIWLGTNSPTPVGELGFYPSSDYSGTFQSAGSIFSAGAEVDDATDYNKTANTDTFTLPMGSGQQPTAGWGEAAYVHDYEVFQNNTGVNRSFDTPYSTESQYAVSTTPAAGYFWENYFYLGDAPPPAPGSTVSN